VDPTSTDLSFVWIARIEAKDAVSVGNLRTVAGVEAALGAGVVWLRGSSNDEALPVELARLSAQVFRWLPPDGLALLESEIPVARLPELEWRPLCEMTRPTVEQLLLPGKLSQRLALRLTPSGKVDCEPNVLQTSLSDLEKWVGSSAEIRWKELRFAAGYDGTVIVRGTPIPSLPGSRYFESDGVAIPLGQRLDPPVPSSVLAQAMQLVSGDLGIFRGEHWERIEGANFVPVSRAAVRLTAQNPQFANR
tara:strand:+ start:7920 stop:8666 length:747 start_codon:yes stop_codon:yes gene_type:complete